MMPGWYGIAKLSRTLTEQQGSLAEAWSRAARRSGEESREFGETTNSVPAPDLAAGFGDFLRAQWFLWAGAGISALERIGRDTPGFTSQVLPLRALALGTVASELYAGYAALREREHVLILGTGACGIRFRPALTATIGELDAAVDALDRVLSSQA